MNDDRRVSAYIDEMVRTQQGTYLVKGWDDDLKQLKHYRWIRNQIVHDPSCTEENMCSCDDEQWVINFHARIMNQTDPLALYCQATQPRRTTAKKDTDRENNEWNYNEQRRTRNLLGCRIVLLITMAIVIVAVIWWLLNV